MPKCEKCQDLGVIEIKNKLYECDCALVRRISSHMPSYVRKINYQKEHLQLGLLKHIDKSIYIKSTWLDMRAILKALYFLYPNKFIKITSDAEIRDVYVGSRSRQSVTDDFDGDVYNNLQDLVGPPDLLIVKLGDIRNKNKAAPGALYESLKHRIDYDKPAWVWTDIECQFGLGSFAYSEQVAEMLFSGFIQLSIPVILRVDPVTQYFQPSPAPSVASPSTPTASNVGEVTIKEKPKKTERKPSSKPITEIDDEDLGSLAGYGGGVKKSKNFQKS